MFLDTAEIFVQYLGPGPIPSGEKWRIRDTIVSALKSCRWRARRLLVHGVVEVGVTGASEERLMLNPNPEHHGAADLILSLYCVSTHDHTHYSPATIWAKASSRLPGFELILVLRHLDGDEIIRIRDGSVIVHEFLRPGGDAQRIEVKSLLGERINGVST